MKKKMKTKLTNEREINQIYELNVLKVSNFMDNRILFIGRIPFSVHNLLWHLTKTE